MGLNNCKPTRINNSAYLNNVDNIQTQPTHVNRENIDYKLNFTSNPNNDKFFIESIKYSIKNEYQDIYDYLKFDVKFYLKKEIYGHNAVITNINCDESDFNVIFVNYLHFNFIETIPLDLCINEDCSICLDQLTDITNSKKMPTKLNCGHVFHYSCIEQWHQNKPNCPICREPINTIIIN